jgi:branched-chain amino acid transport system substrate-binding protein
MKMRNDRHWLTAAAAVGIVAVVASPAAAQRKYDPGASDREIKIGNTAPYSGPLSAYGEIGKTFTAYFHKINAEGGVNGRKITFISCDDASSPPKTVEQTRKLVESDEVLFIFGAVGTAPNTAIQRYMNAKKVPQLFVSSGATKWNDPQHFPWTMGFIPNYESEGRIYAEYLLNNHWQGKVGVLYQNDDYGKDYLKGLKDGLNGKMQIVAEMPYEVTDPTVDSQVINIKASGADIFFDVALSKFAAQATKKVADLGWKPVHLLNSVSVSVGAVLKPAGLDNAKGVLSAQLFKDPTDPTWKDDATYKEWSAFMDKYYRRRRQDIDQHGVRPCASTGTRPGAQAMRRQPHPRERHEAGGQPERFGTRHAAAGHQGQHQPERLCAGQADADDALQRRELGTVRPSDDRRGRPLTKTATARNAVGHRGGVPPPLPALSNTPGALPPVARARIRVRRGE